MSNCVQDALRWFSGFLLAGDLSCALALAGAHGKNLDGRYDNAPNKEWYESQHNAKGQWCCNESDGHPYFGDYTFREDGSVVLDYEGQRYVIPDTLVLKGTNPTGHAVWWFLEGRQGAPPTASRQGRSADGHPFAGSAEQRF
jgi:hypothetical protein